MSIRQIWKPLLQSVTLVVISAGLAFAQDAQSQSTSGTTQSNVQGQPASQTNTTNTTNTTTQTNTATATTTNNAAFGAPQPSKVDLFTGYSWSDPKGTILGNNIASFNRGIVLSGTYWGNRWAGFTIDSGFHMANKQALKYQTVTFGPSFRYYGEHFTPFVHALFGISRLDAKSLALGSDIGATALLGGGFDIHATHRLDLRLAEVDLGWSHHRFNFDTTKQVGPELRTGLVWKFGTVGPPPVPPSAACSVQPAEIYEGEPIKVTATPSNFNPKRTLNYAWSGNGLKINGTGATADVDTKGLQPGQYTVTANVTDGKKGMASCNTSFTVKQPRPPVISCSANPTSVEPGQTANITCEGSSPDNRQVTYKHSTSAGNLTENGPNATLNTAGAQAGPITVTSTINDDRNLSANTSTTVTVQAPPPPPPPPPSSSKLSDINFKKNNARVDNAAKAVLDDVALRMQREADSKLVIVGSTDPSEKAKNLAAQRAVNAKAYLVNEKGIDASRISVASNPGQGTTATMWLVPAGASAPSEGTPVDESKVKATKSRPAAHKRAGKKKAAATPKQ